MKRKFISKTEKENCEENKNSDDEIIKDINEHPTSSKRDYHETLHSEEKKSKKKLKAGKKDTESWKQQSWESIRTIEKNVDSLKKKQEDQKNHQGASPVVSHVEKKVDRLLSRKKQSL